MPMQALFAMHTTLSEAALKVKFVANPHLNDAQNRNIIIKSKQDVLEKPDIKLAYITIE
jgi:hypothetical protein